MSGETAYHVTLRNTEGFEFKAEFDDVPGAAPLVFDEPPPLGGAHGPNAAAGLAAAVGNCLAASLLLCLKKSHTAPVGLSATVTAREGERTLFLAEAVQAGIFSLRNFSQEELGPLLGIACPNILYPYLRETISDLVTRGGFPPVLLAPVSFEAVYMQKLQQQQQQSQGSPKIEVAR